MAAVDARLAQLQAQLNDLAKSMTLALQTGQDQALAAFKVQFRQLSAQAATLRAQASMSDAPSSFLVALDSLSDQAIALGEKVGAPVSDLLGSTSTLLKLVPLLVVALVVGLIVWANRGNLKVNL